MSEKFCVKTSFVTECKKEQWIVDRLILHESCKNIYIEHLDDEVLLCCEDCQEVILNFYRKEVFN